MAKAAKSKPAKTGKRRLKVYQATLGFYDAVVAAPNQGEALKAWGVRQNLFSEGAASLADDPETVQAALAHPGAPLRRAMGSRDAFALNPEPPALQSRSKADQFARKAPDRTALSAAEAALKDAERRHADAAADIERRRRALDDEEAEVREAWVQSEKEFRHALDKARRAFLRGGGDSKA